MGEKTENPYDIITVDPQYLVPRFLNFRSALSLTKLERFETGSVDNDFSIIDDNRWGQSGIQRRIISEGRINMTDSSRPKREFVSKYAWDSSKDPWSSRFRMDGAQGVRKLLFRQTTGKAQAGFESYAHSTACHPNDFSLEPHGKFEIQD